MTSDVTKAVNVYVENANITDKYNVFCVMNGERKYITLGHDGTKYALSFNNAPITAFEYDENFCLVKVSHREELMLVSIRDVEFIEDSWEKMLENMSR